MFFFFLFAIGISLELYDISFINNHSLGNNLLANPSFDSPTIPPGNSFYYYTAIEGWWWDSEGQLVDIDVMCSQYAVDCMADWTQALSLDSMGVYYKISQHLQIKKEALYLLHLEWMPPFVNPIDKAFEIKINSSTMASITVVSPDMRANIEEYVFKASVGSLTLGMNMVGASPDWSGIMISNLRLQQMIPPPLAADPQFQSALETLFANNLSKTVNKIPGNRVLLYSLTNFLSTFDRLQLYYLHRQNHSYYADSFLSSIYQFNQNQGNLLQSLLNQCNNQSQTCASIITLYDSLIESVDSQYAYTDTHFLIKNPNGRGFFANNMQFFCYKLPMILIVYLVLFLMFKALFNLRVSLYLRKYAFTGILLLMVYQGNMEQLSFYFFLQAKNLFSRTIYHKMGKVFMVYFYFLTIVFGVGGLLLLKLHYKKLVKYFAEDYTGINLRILMLQALEKSIFPVLFGCVHALLIEQLSVQSLILGAVELGYFGVKVITVQQQGVKFRLKVVFLSVTSALRMVFIATAYLFESCSGPSVINQIHYHIIWIYLLCWAVELLYDGANLIVEAIMQIVKSCQQSSKDPVKLKRKQKLVEGIQQNLEEKHSKMVKNKQKRKQQRQKVRLIPMKPEQNQIKCKETISHKKNSSKEKTPDILLKKLQEEMRQEVNPSNYRT